MRLHLVASTSQHVPCLVSHRQQAVRPFHQRVFTFTNKTLTSSLQDHLTVTVLSQTTTNTSLSTSNAEKKKEKKSYELKKNKQPNKQKQKQKQKTIPVITTWDYSLMAQSSSWWSHDYKRWSQSHGNIDQETEGFGFNVGLATRTGDME